MSRQPRLDFIDNLRWVMIIFVVGMHAACTYSHVGGWYYRSEVMPDTVSTVVFLIFQGSLQAFFMGFMFFLAGYFVPSAYDRKGFGRFLGDRAVRLGLPTLLYVFVIHIGMGLFLLDWYGKSGLTMAEAYANYIVHGDWLDGTGPMWFAATLLFFCVVYALFRLLAPRIPEPKSATPRFGAIMSLGVAVGVITFVVRQVAPVGSSWHNMQLCFFPQYVVLFVLGILAKRHGWIEALPARWGKPVLRSALIVAPLSIICLVILNTTTQGSFDAIKGGMRWQAAAYALLEQVLCVLFCTGLLIVFRDGFNFRNKLISFLSNNGFAVYVIHPPVLVAITLAMRPLALPPLKMFALAWIAATMASFAIGAVLRQLPVLKRIL